VHSLKTSFENRAVYSSATTDKGRAGVFRLFHLPLSSAFPANIFFASEGKHLSVGDSSRPELRVRDFRKAKFFWLDNEVVDDFLPKIGGTAFAVYAYLCRYASNSTQECWPSMSQMAERLQLSKSTVRRSLIALNDISLIKIEKGQRGGDRHEPNTYVLLTVKPSAVDETRKPSSPSSIPSAKPSAATVPEQDLLTTLTNKGAEFHCPKCQDSGTWEHKGHKRQVYCLCPTGKAQRLADGQ
jgi:DNA-binding MarR family transcriptional regulator